MTHRILTHSAPPRLLPRRVVKVGGSLLTVPCLESVVRNWWSRQTPLPTLFVVGGGDLADAVRALDRRATLDATTAHWMAIRAMQVNSFTFCQVLDEAEWVTNACHWLDRLTPLARRSIGVVAIEEFLRSQEPQHPGTRLPVGWHVTSDSIAARLAEVVHAAELVLLKSTLPATGSTSLSLPQAVAAELVDEFFPVSAARSMLTRIVNLRAAEFDEVQVRPS